VVVNVSLYMSLGDQVNSPMRRKAACARQKAALSVTSSGLVGSIPARSCNRIGRVKGMRCILGPGPEAGGFSLLQPRITSLIVLCCRRRSAREWTQEQSMVELAGKGVRPQCAQKRT
jgi:hypothetical protein